jgi:hypothetical protein
MDHSGFRQCWLVRLRCTRLCLFQRTPIFPILAHWLPREACTFDELDKATETIRSVSIATHEVFPCPFSASSCCNLAMCAYLNATSLLNGEHLLTICDGHRAMLQGVGDYDGMHFASAFLRAFSGAQT